MAVQICVYGYEQHGNGNVQFDVEVKREVDNGEGGVALVAIGSGHRSVTLDAAQLNAIAAQTTTDGAKLQAMAGLIRADVLTWRAAESEDATNWVASIAPTMSREKPVIFPLR